MDTADQKSIFGVLVGLFALFVLWLWASGNAATLWAAATGSSSTPGQAAGGSFGSYASTPYQTVAPASSNPSSTGAIQVPSYFAIGGYTTNGAMSGGVSVTPTALLGLPSIPVFNTTFQPTSTVDAYGVPSNGGYYDGGANFLKYLFGGAQGGSTGNLGVNLDSNGAVLGTDYSNAVAA